MMTCLLLVQVQAVVHATGAWTAELSSFDSKPVISFVDGTSSFAFAFNPSWIEAGANQPNVGLIIRTQNCTGCGTGYSPSAKTDKGCCHCAGTDQKSSILTFAKLKGKVSSFAPNINRTLYRKYE
jgi:hypothetical protein